MKKPPAWGGPPVLPKGGPLLWWISSQRSPPSPRLELPPSQQHPRVTTSGAGGCHPYRHIVSTFPPFLSSPVYFFSFLLAHAFLPLTSSHALKNSWNGKNKSLFMVLPCPDDLLTTPPLLGQQSYISTRKEQGSPPDKRLAKAVIAFLGKEGRWEKDSFHLGWFWRSVGTCPELSAFCRLRSVTEITHSKGDNKVSGANSEQFQHHCGSI